MDNLTGVLVNHLENPSIETNTTNWVGTDQYFTNGTSTLTRVSTQAKIGTWSLQVATPGGAANEGASETTGITVTAGTTYTFSTYVKVTSGTAAYV